MNKNAARYFSYLAIFGAVIVAMVTVIDPNLYMVRDAVLSVGLGVLALWLQNEAKA